MGPEFSPQVPCKNRVDQGIPLAATRRSLGLIGQAIQPNGKLRGSVRDLVSERKVRLIQEDNSLWNTHILTHHEGRGEYGSYTHRVSMIH